MSQFVVWKIRWLLLSMLLFLRSKGDFRHPLFLLSLLQLQGRQETSFSHPQYTKEDIEDKPFCLFLRS